MRVNTTLSNFTQGEEISKIYAGDISSFLVTTLGRVFVWGFSPINSASILTPTLLNIPSLSNYMITNIGLRESILVLTTSTQVLEYNVAQFKSDEEKQEVFKTLSVLKLDLGKNETITSLETNGNTALITTSESRLFIWGCDVRCF